MIGKWKMRIIGHAYRGLDDFLCTIGEGPCAEDKEILEQSHDVETFSSMLQKLVANKGKIIICFEIHRYAQSNPLKSLEFYTTPPWHSLCFIPRYELLPRISDVPIQRVVLADRFPIGNVQSTQQPDHSAHPEPTDGTLRTKAGGNNTSRPPVRAGWQRYLTG